MTAIPDEDKPKFPEIFGMFPADMKTMHCRISGLVQGVGFRYFTLQRARALGLRGYVQNLYTGEVEVVAQGSEDALAELRGALRHGPRSAQVQNLRVEWPDEEDMYNSFEIR